MNRLTYFLGLEERIVNRRAMFMTLGSLGLLALAFHKGRGGASAALLIDVRGSRNGCTIAYRG